MKIFIKSLMKFLFVFGNLLLLTAYASLAQSPWSLEKCISYALEHNIQVKQKILSNRMAENNLGASYAAVLPNLNAGADQRYSFGRSVDQYTNSISTDNRKSNNFYLQSQVTLFQGLQNLNSIKRDRLNLMASIQDVEKMKNDIGLYVASTYLEILFNRELVNVAKDQREITHLQVERTGKLVEAGRLAQGTLLEIQAQLEQEDLQIINAENTLNLSYLNLTQLLELDSVGNFSIEIPSINLDQSHQLLDPVDLIYKDAINTLPEVKASEIRVEKSVKELSIANGGYSPSLSMSASYYTGYSDVRRMIDPTNLNEYTMGYVGSMEGTKVVNISPGSKNYPFADQLKDNASKSLTLTLSIPIFNNLRNHTNVSNATINLDMTKNNLQITKNQVYKDIQQAHANATASMKKYIATEKALTSTEEAFKYSEQKYNVGLINSVEYSTSKNQLTKVKSDLVQAKFDYIFRKTILDFYRGKTIKL